MIEVIVSISTLICAAYILLMLYYRALYKKIQPFSPVISTIDPKSLPHNTTITVVIPARNEEENIGRCIDSLLEQTYSREAVEIIIVDDHSEDATPQIVNGYSQPNIRLIKLEDFLTSPLNSYKKKAIEIAISQSANELIVTTDADCVLPEKWLETIVAFFEEKQPVFIAAPVLIENTSRFIGIFQALDFMSLQGITAAAVSGNKMTMCNGANMAYTRRAYTDVQGFAGIDTIASGDDMLLMNKIFKKQPDRVMYLHSHDAVVKTKSVDSVRDFLRQRIRWASKSNSYDDKRILPVLLLVYLFNVCLLLLPIIALINNKHITINNYTVSVFQIWFGMLIVKTIAELWFLYPVARFFNNSVLLWYFPFLQPFHILYTIIAGFLGMAGSYRWKDRKVS